MNNKFLKFILFFTIIFNVSISPSCSVENNLENRNYLIFIDINELSLSLVDSDTKEFIKKYPIAAGKTSTPSPIGQWQIISKAKKNGHFGGFWLGLNTPWDTFGLHGTNNPSSIGSLASGGCIRMYNHYIEEVFNLVTYDTRVIIYAGPNWLFSPYARNIKPNDKGTDVYYVQKALKNIGYYSPVPDGIYGYSLEVAVNKYRNDANLPGDSTIDEKLLNSLGIYKQE